mmetsp:Transcript_19243/g.56714  ORF Transcript_19243/g.56714 Transcript_19243/m.56714 type:complete len:395 (+) Transcript_19243:605-1789(+)
MDTLRGKRPAERSPQQSAGAQVRRPLHAGSVRSGKEAQRAFSRIEGVIAEGRHREAEVERLRAEHMVCRAELTAREQECERSEARLRDAFRDLQKSQDIVLALRAELGAEQLRRKAVEESDAALRKKMADMEAAAANRRPAPWRAAELRDGGALSGMCRACTGLHNLKILRLFFNIVIDGRGCTVAGRAHKLDIWYAPKHAPKRIPGEPAAPDSASGNAKCSRQLSGSKPAGPDPFDAYFMVVTMLRLGLHVDEAAVLFDISKGSVSQIYTTYVPFISRALEAWTPWPAQNMVGASLPKAFKEMLARTSASSRCRIILDATEIEVQIPDDDFLKTLFYSKYKKRHTLKYLIGITPCRSITFVSCGLSWLYPGQRAHRGVWPQEWRCSDGRPRLH